VVLYAFFPRAGRRLAVRLVAVFALCSLSMCTYALRTTGLCNFSVQKLHGNYCKRMLQPTPLNCRCIGPSGFEQQKHTGDRPVMCTCSCCNSSAFERNPCCFARRDVVCICRSNRNPNLGKWQRKAEISMLGIYCYYHKNLNSYVMYVLTVMSFFTLYKNQKRRNKCRNLAICREFCLYKPYTAI
jgi:hypothetical protein